MPGAVVSVTCGQNTDTNGPRVSTYGLFADVAALKDELHRIHRNRRNPELPRRKGITGLVVAHPGPEDRPRPSRLRHLQGDRSSGDVEQ